MRQSPQYIVPLLLFLIAVLLGSLVWLQYTQVGRHGDTDQTGQADNTDTNAILEPTEESQAEEAEEAEGHEQGERQSASGSVERPAIVRPEPLRNPAPDEYKPDMGEIEKQDAARQAAIDALLAESAGAPQVANPGGDPDEDLGARVQWLVPPLARLGFVTPPRVRGEGYMEAGAISASTKEELVEAGYVIPDEKGWHLLVGKVELPDLTLPERALWSPQKGPPIVVTLNDIPVVANADGWFAMPVSPNSKSGNALKVAAPGMRMEDSREEVVIEFGKLRANRGVTVRMERAPQIVFTVKYNPVSSAKNDLRAWLEIWSPAGELREGLPRPGLFITSRVPSSGMLTFMLPHPGSWTDRPVRFGASGDGWNVSSPQRLDLGAYTRGARRDDVQEDKVIRLRAALTLTRTHTQEVSGRCRQPDGSAPRGFVRLEGSHTGVVTWTDSRARFGMHVGYEKGNWRQDLKIETLAGQKFAFGLAYDDQRLPFAELETGGSAPVGPWVITLPEDPVAEGRVWLCYNVKSGRYPQPPMEIWLRRRGVLHALVLEPAADARRRLWRIPDVIMDGDEIMLKFRPDGPYVVGALSLGEVPASMAGKPADKPAEGGPSEPPKESSDKEDRRCWFITVPD